LVESEPACPNASQSFVLVLRIRASAEALARAHPKSMALRTSLSIAPRSCSGAARFPSSASRWMSHSAVATMPMLTEGSPASSRCNVGTVTPIRPAQILNDSFRRKRATAKSAPNFSRTARVAAGSCCRARAVFGMQIECVKIRHFVYVYFNIERFRRVCNPRVVHDASGNSPGSIRRAVWDFSYGAAGWYSCSMMQATESR
jgi:hypothetical protein